MGTVAVAVLMTTATSACMNGAEPPGAPGAPVSIHLKTQGWTGWSREQPPPQVQLVQVQEHQEVPLSQGRTLEISAERGGAAAITMTDVTERKASGGIDLDGCGTQRAVLEPGEQITYVTCTMDAGTSWTISHRGAATGADATPGASTI